MKFIGKAATLVLTGALALGMSPAAPAIAALGAGTGEAQAATLAAQATAYADGTYTATAETDFGMFKLDPSATVVVKDGTPYVTVASTAIDSTTKSPKYDAIWVGDDYAKLPDASTSDVIAGVPVYGDEIAADDTTTYNDGSGKAIVSYRFTIPTTFEKLESGIGYVARYTSHYKRGSNNNSGAWSGTELKTFTFSNITKTSEDTDLPQVKAVQLSVTNEERMFVCVNAYVSTEADGKQYLYFALNGSGVSNVIPGTYYQALDASADGTRTGWIAGSRADVDVAYTASDGKQVSSGSASKIQFKVPVTIADSGTANIAVTSASDSKVKSAEAENPSAPDYTSAFQGRQFLVDMDTKSVTVGNYTATVDAVATSSVESFGVESAAKLYTYGQANSNEFTVSPTISLTTTAYDKAYVGTLLEAATSSVTAAAAGAESTIPITDGSVTLPFAYSHDGDIHTVIIDDYKTVSGNVAFHNVLSGKWVLRTFTIDLRDDTIAISGEEDAAASGSASSSGSSQAVSADTASAPAPKVTQVTINKKTVSAAAVKKAIGSNKSTVTTVVLGKKVKKVSKKAFAKYAKVKTLVVKTTKLTKASVKGSLKGSKVKAVRVAVGSKAKNKKYVKKYKKLFTKANAGKKASVKR